MYRLANHGYEISDRGLAFPILTPSDIERFLELRQITKENALIRQFRDWVKVTIKSK